MGIIDNIIYIAISAIRKWAGNMMVVAHNPLVMDGNRMLKINTNKKAKSIEKLSFGYCIIDRSTDDAASLAILQKMRGQIKGLT